MNKEEVDLFSRQLNAKLYILVAKEKREFNKYCRIRWLALIVYLFIFIGLCLKFKK